MEANTINGKQQYLTAPLVLLHKNHKDDMMPIAIQVNKTETRAASLGKKKHSLQLETLHFHRYITLIEDFCFGIFWNKQREKFLSNQAQKRPWTLFIQILKIFLYIISIHKSTKTSGTQKDFADEAD